MVTIEISKRQTDNTITRGLYISEKTRTTLTTSMQQAMHGWGRI